MEEDKYNEIVDRISTQAAEDLKKSHGSDSEIRKTLCKYLRCGDVWGLSRPELIDFLGVSTPSILDAAGFSNEEAQHVMDLLAEMSEDEIQRESI